MANVDIDLYVMWTKFERTGRINTASRYTLGTPNGHKISVTLEELGIKYNTHKIDISKNVQKEPWFLKINPNGRIPAIIDKTSGKPKRIFEGASIQLYLCEKYDKDHKISFPYDSDEYWVGWLDHIFARLNRLLLTLSRRH